MLGRLFAIKNNEDLFRYLFDVEPNELQRTALATMSPDNNYVVVAPTGAGKTFVGLFYMILRGRGVYLTRTRANCWEKYIYIKNEIVPKTGIRALIANKDFSAPPKVIVESDLVVTTPYKLSQYIGNRSVVNWIKDALIVVDEAHNMDPTTEFMVSWALSKGAKVILLSATINDEDANAMAKWIGGTVIKPKIERPVPLFYHEVRVKTAINDYSMVPVFRVEVNGRVIEGDTIDEVVAKYIVDLYLKERTGVLYWAPTRGAVEELAKLISYTLYKEAPELIKQWDQEKNAVISKLGSGTENDKTLRNILSEAPVAFHHGGLSTMSRNAVQEFFVKRKIPIVGTAYTLAEGVNLPARHLVITRLTDFEGNLIDATLFHQLSGRAGRPGLDNEGHVHIVITTDSESAYLNQYLLKVRAEPVASRIYDEDFLERTILRIVAYGLRDPASLREPFKRTYFAALHGDAGLDAVLRSVENILRKLLDQGYLVINNGRLDFPEPKREYEIAALMGLKLDEKAIADSAASDSVSVEALLNMLADKAVQILSSSDPDLKEKYEEAKSDAILYGLEASVNSKHRKWAQEIAEKMFELAGAMFLYRLWSHYYRDPTPASKKLKEVMNILATGINEVAKELRQLGVPTSVLKRITRNYALELRSPCIEKEKAAEIYRYALEGYKTKPEWAKKLWEKLNTITCKT
jgi:replicative superfamily II helicase